MWLTIYLEKILISLAPIPLLSLVLHSGGYQDKKNIRKAEVTKSL